MARLFITPREIDLISDLTKEVIKDISGQKVYYYRVREDLTDIHDVYEESPNKVFDQPVEIEARVEYQPEELRTNQFGSEEFYSINVFFHERDLLDREIEVRTGDYFSYGDTFFEITSAVVESNVYGQIEHSIGMKVVGKQARLGQIDMVPLGPTSESYTDDDAVQDTFVQQRGFEENKLGKTEDKRQLISDGKIEKPNIDSPAEVSPDGDSEGISSSFYGDR
tara:strand:+ start:1475 stop:2143 length:669 start_codon:yes stop_codon:yes gene_type:complete